MKSPQSERVVRSLLRLEGQGTFVASHREPALGLFLEVEGVGRCNLPLRREQIEALLDRATPSPFGYRDQTLTDPAVRSSVELPGSAIELTPRGWAPRFERGLEEVCEALGFPPEAKVTPVLSKLVLYQEGQFFARHRDTERDANMAASLVVVLPSVHEGGELVVSHAGEEVLCETSSGSQKHLSFVGFYADCVHEVRPVTSGTRVALTYALHVEAAGTASPSFVVDEEFPDLCQSVEAFFDKAEWMVVLLDHHYSTKSLTWARLKNSDRARADALRRVARTLNAKCFLALADVRETYEAPEGDQPGELPPGGYGPLVDLSVTLDHWLDEAGEPCAGTDLEGDIECTVSTIDSHTRAAYHQWHEPWTGNEGGTADRWYHQTALVVVPGGDLLQEMLDPPL
ncbi:MAG: 2OG-Fe(II) oxygenase [Myxococcota bacterium]